MREPLRPEEIMYTVLTVVIAVLMTAGFGAAFFLSEQRETILRALFYIGFLLNLMGIVRLLYRGQRRSLPALVVLSGLSLYFALRW